MVRSDDRILDTIESEGNMTPLALSREGEHPRLDISRNWAGQRCRLLVEAGLLERLERGLYGITDDGLAYLRGELDASTLPPPDDG
ncbi:MAG: hypothetical protein ACOCY1_00390 [Halovenus sp.]